MSVNNIKYLALIRGINVGGNTKVDMKTLIQKLENEGFNNVQTILNSGNVIFDSDVNDIRLLETTIQKLLTKSFGINQSVIIRSQKELETIYASKPFGDKRDSPTSRLNISFIKGGGEIFLVINPQEKSTVDTMKEIEKKYGKENTTMRTWKTLSRITDKMNQ